MPGPTLLAAVRLTVARRRASSALDDRAASAAMPAAADRPGIPRAPMAVTSRSAADAASDGRAATSGRRTRRGRDSPASPRRVASSRAASSTWAGVLGGVGRPSSRRSRPMTSRQAGVPASSAAAPSGGRGCRPASGAAWRRRRLRCRQQRDGRGCGRPAAIVMLRVSAAGDRLIEHVPVQVPPEGRTAQRRAPRRACRRSGRAAVRHLRRRELLGHVTPLLVGLRESATAGRSARSRSAGRSPSSGRSTRWS